MLSNTLPKALVLIASLGTLAANTDASVIVESSRRTTWAIAGTRDTGGGVDTDTSSALGPVTLSSSMGPTEFVVESSVTMASSSSSLGISGSVDLSQRGLDDSYFGFLDRYIAAVWVDHVMTFVIDEPTPYRMEVRTASSSWELAPIYGLILAAGAWNSLDDDGLSYFDAVFQPVSGLAVTEGVLLPGRYTTFYRFTSAYFGPNTFDLSNAALDYRLTVPSPGAGATFALGVLAGVRRRQTPDS
ncbi:MAG: hypothetical protein SFZ23_11280 [Planctomycetota bacterium]|nr:hypothetical protein [Planctomycetota bacterium]